MTLALTGFMGSGKTSTGKILAERLGWPFADLDELVAEVAGKTIPEIFEESGEEAFRALEFNTLRLYLNSYQGDSVLALGGGTLTLPESRDLIKRNCRCIYLKADADALLENLTWKGEAGKRPLLSGGKDLKERIEELLDARSATYESAADITVNAERLTPEQIADDILTYLETLSDLKKTKGLNAPVASQPYSG